AAPAAYRALDVLEVSATSERAESFEAENVALAELICSPQFAAGVYAFDLTSRRAKNPAGAPEADLARPVRSIGVAGAGLMASQLGLLFARRMQVPVIMRDLDAGRTERGVGYVSAELDKIVANGRMAKEVENRVRC